MNSDKNTLLQDLIQGSTLCVQKSNIIYIMQYANIHGLIIDCTKMIDVALGSKMWKCLKAKGVSRIF